MSQKYDSEPRVLIADDDPVTRRLLEHHLKSAGFETVSAKDGQEAKERLGPEICVALVDLNMPKASGIEVLQHSQRTFPDLPVVVISQNAELRTAVEAMKYGAIDFVTKPLDPEAVIAQVRQAQRTGKLAVENRQLKHSVSVSTPAPPFVAKSKSAQTLRQQIDRVASLDSTVLISGESGAGKTSVARLIHQLSPRRDQPFIAVSCASLPADLVESELFGHIKGAYTGAIADRIGKAEMADGGTLFLDEIGDMPLALQPKLLTFLQDRIVQRIGDSRPRRVDVRLITATNQDLEEKCRERSFRQDLFFRLNVIPLEVPRLRERLDDIPELTTQVLKRIADKRGLTPFQVDPSALEVLLTYDWPGNVRELENVLERASAYCQGDRITPEDLSIKPYSPVAALGETKNKLGLATLTFAEIERRAILETLEHCQGNKKKAAQMLHIDEKSIYNKMKRLGLMG